MATTGSPDDSLVMTTICVRGAKYTCSYAEDHHAMDLAVNWIEANLDERDTVAVFTDIQSLCNALTNTSTELDTLRALMAALKPALTIPWIPGQCEIG